MNLKHKATLVLGFSYSMLLQRIAVIWEIC